MNVQSKASAASALALLLLFAGVGCDSVVGGTCAAGYEQCGDRCVANGACAGGADAPGGRLTLVPEAGPTSSDAAATSEGGTQGGDGGDAATNDSGAGGDAPSNGDAPGGDTAPSADGASSDAADACPPPPFDDAANCGACGTTCSGSTPVCRPSGSTWSCAPSCGAGETDCGGACVDVSSDAANCGGCGVVCASGLCNGGVCRGAIPGHLVVIGHDYVSPTSAASRLLTNAAFLPMHNPVRVLAYTASAEASAITGVDSTLDAAATSGRTWTKTVATALSDFDALSIDRFDVVLFYDQPTAAAGSLSDLGASLRPKLLSFGEAGGVVIVLDGASGVDQMPAFLSSTTLLAVDSDTTIRAAALDVVAPGDAIGVDVLTPYLSPMRTASFTLTAGTGGDATIVVDEPTSSAPVVLHRVMLLP